MGNFSPVAEALELEDLPKTSKSAQITWPVTELVGLRGKKARESPGLKLPPTKT